MTSNDEQIKNSLDTIRTYNDFLKKNTNIEIINVNDAKDKMYGTITRIYNKSIQLKRYDDTELSELIYDKFEKALMPTKKLPKQIDTERFKYLKEGDRVLVYEGNIRTHKRDGEEEKYDEKSYNQYKGKFTDTAASGGNVHYDSYHTNKDNKQDEYIPILYKGSVKETGATETGATETGEKYVNILRDDDNTNIAKSYNIDGTIDGNSDKFYQLRIIDRTKDIESIKLLIYDNKKKFKTDKIISKIERDPKNKENILLRIDEKKYKVKQSPYATAQILKIEQKIKQSNAKMELGKLKYKIRWNYKTNYSGSKYFPLKVSNIKLLSESEKYSQIDKYTDLKEGDIVKYNDSSHKNYGLLAKVVSIGEDTRDARKYYETRKLYTITFEPFESYVPTAELKQYKRKYQNMEKSIANVSASKLLKFRFVEVFYYEKDIFDTVKDTGKKEGEGMDKKKRQQPTKHKLN
jgi:hypothetical protein